MVWMARIKKLSVVSKRLTGDWMIFSQVSKWFCVQDEWNRAEDRTLQQRAENGWVYICGHFIITACILNLILKYVAEKVQDWDWGWKLDPKIWPRAWRATGQWITVQYTSLLNSTLRTCFGIVKTKDSTGKQVKILKGTLWEQPQSFFWLLCHFMQYLAMFDSH